MAVVDFSNAILDVYDNTKKPMTVTDYMKLGSSSYLYDEQGQPINSNNTMSILSNTPTKVSILYTGAFISSGTSFHTDQSQWKVTNISFSSGDSYAFVIDIEVSGST